MPKLTLNVNSLKTLASETRLDILKLLDGKKMSLKELSEATNLHEVTVHEHLSKLIEGGFVNKHEREGHKWVYYQLSWQGTSLIHPENTKVIVLFSSTFISFFFGVILLINSFFSSEISGIISADNPGSLKDGHMLFLSIFPGSVLFIIAIVCMVLFIILMSLSIRRYRRNKIPKL